MTKHCCGRAGAQEVGVIDVGAAAQHFVAAFEPSEHVTAGEPAAELLGSVGPDKQEPLWPRAGQPPERLDTVECINVNTLRQG